MNVRNIFKCTMLVSALITNMAYAGTVVIDASFGSGTEVQVQTALDANPPGTTFLLKGDFNFSWPVFIEKSNTTILGEMVDFGDGKPSPDDQWNTVINGPFFVAFELGPRNWIPDRYDISNITISGINFALPLAVGINPNGGPGDCDGPAHPYSVDRVQFENNFVEGGGVHFTRNVSRVSVDNNLFTGVVPPNANPVNFLGYTLLEDCPTFFVHTWQKDNSVTNNTFDGTTNIYSGRNSGLRITGNKMTGLTIYDGERITLYEQQDLLVSDNFLQGDSTNTGILFFSRNLNPNLPGIFSKNITIRDNILIDMDTAMLIFGGLTKSSIKGNHIAQSGTFNPLGATGIMVVDDASVIWPSFVNSSSHFEITDNHIADTAATGILLNGDTSGIRMVNNIFSNPDSAFGDIALWPTDLLFASGLCPASDNTIIATNFATEVVDFDVPVCAGDKPNKLLGTLELINKDLGNMPPEVEANMQELIQQLVDKGIGRPVL